jgi:hypothetical protein
MMPGESYKEVRTSELNWSLKTFIGLILIIAGILISIWVFMNIYKIFTNPKEIEIFKQIVPNSPELREIEIEGKKIILPPGIFHFMVYLIGCFLLFIAGIIAGGFITGGVNLLQSKTQRLELSFKRKFEILKNKINQIREILKKKTDTT